MKALYFFAETSKRETFFEETTEILHLCLRNLENKNRRTKIFILVRHVYLQWKITYRRIIIKVGTNRIAS